MSNVLANALYMVLATMLLLCLLFSAAAIFYPEFRDGGTGIITVILGALTTTLGSILVGFRLNRPMEEAAQQEVQQEISQEQQQGKIGGPPQ